MISSLYTRVVLTFLASVIGGTVIAFFATTWIFQDKLNENLQSNLFDFGQDVVHIYNTLPLDEAEAFVSEMKQLHSYYIRIYTTTDQFRSYGELKGQEPFSVTNEEVQQVLDGQNVHINGIDTIFLGLPIKTERGNQAIFIEPLTSSSNSFLIKFVLTFLFCSLIAGSLLILVAAIFLVRPIKKLTKATRLIADGDFNIQLNIKQKGEIGMLARSFEEMMRDLQQLEQMRREFVTNVSHEVQSPLTSISGFAIALKQVNLSDEERSSYLDIIITETVRISKISDSLLKLSVLESQSLQMKLVTFDLDEQIRRVIVAIQPQWSARNIQFDLDLSPTSITADYDLLDQVWINLIANGIKFSEKDSQMSITIKQDSKNTIVCISDSGIGILPEDQKHIFDRFFKADRSHSQTYGGSGMGLAIVKQIVSLHQGDIRVESEYGKGTTFIVTLPILIDT
ncbi:sensor histidine kinase [Paenibacillus nicotianae]|uniref:histidine kinase n=1 Tax=Paenibacillus nicotianae TaxID=1526551 RepID=A0ABW4USE0_9BACL